MKIKGSPPLTRGKEGLKVTPVPGGGITPAYAGKSSEASTLALR